MSVIYQVLQNCRIPFCPHVFQSRKDLWRVRILNQLWFTQRQKLRHLRPYILSLYRWMWRKCRAADYLVGETNDFKSFCWSMQSAAPARTIYTCTVWKRKQNNVTNLVTKWSSCMCNISGADHCRNTDKVEQGYPTTEYSDDFAMPVTSVAEMSSSYPRQTIVDWYGNHRL